MEFVVEDIKKSFKKKKVLDGVSFTVSSGQCIGILGGNGSGKSTLLKILGGISSADSGRLVFDNRDFLKDLKHLPNIVGYVPQDNPLIEELTAYDNLRLWYSDEQISKELGQGLLSMLGVGEFLGATVRNMSGGMKKRLSIACTVLNRPLLMLLDEPASSLDIPCKENIYDYLTAYKNQGGSIILVTHDVREMELCDKLYIMRNGKLVDFVYDNNMDEMARLMV